jgi:hypothetical protein
MDMEKEVVRRMDQQLPVLDYVKVDNHPEVGVGARGRRIGRWKRVSYISKRHIRIGNLI